MSIARFFDTNVVVRRLGTVSGNKKTYTTTATVNAHVQKMGREARVKQDIIEENAYLAWFKVNTDIKEGDRVTDQNTGKEFVVQEVNNRTYGINQHLETLMSQKGENE